MSLTHPGIALVTGGASGVGKECALQLAERSARAIVIADINLAGAEKVVEDIKTVAIHKEFRALAINFDLRDEQSIGKMTSKVIDTFGRIDYLAHAAGTVHPKNTTVANADIQDFDEYHHTNARGTLLVNKAVAAAMLRQDTRAVQGRNGVRSIGRGAIVNVSSTIAFAGFPGLTAATSVFHSILGITRNADKYFNSTGIGCLNEILTRVVAIDHAAEGIRVNVVCPVWTETPYQDVISDRLKHNTSVIDRIVPIKRMAKPEEVASAMVYLLSDDASYIQGQSIVLDGGALLV